MIYDDSGFYWGVSTDIMIYISEAICSDPWFLGLFFGSIGRTDWWYFGKTAKTNRNRPQF